jgi:hypothetical protein
MELLREGARLETAATGCIKLMFGPVRWSKQLKGWPGVAIEAGACWLRSEALSLSAPWGKDRLGPGSLWMKG